MATWPTRTSETVLSGADADTLGQDLYDRDECVKEGPIAGIYVADQSVSSSSHADLVTFTLRVPVWVRSGDKIRMRIKARKNTSGTGYFRLRETGVPTNGTEASVASTSYAVVASDVTVPDNTWAGVVKTFAVQARTDGSAGNTDLTIDGVLGNLSAVAA
jgi:hypothetical protein